MDRRKFLAAMVAAGLYLPTKTIFLPPKGGWPVGNALITPEQLTRHSLMLLSSKIGLERRTKMEKWYGVYPIDYRYPPGDFNRYGQNEPDMIGGIADSYND